MIVDKTVKTINKRTNLAEHVFIASSSYDIFEHQLNMK